MRLFLLPVSTRRTLIYCERVQQQQLPAGVKAPISERIINRASQTWTQWERAEKGWQKSVADWGNRLFKRIPYEEWGLKSIPPATKKRLQDADDGTTKFECLYPSTFLKEDRVMDVLRKLATERQDLHKKNLWYCLIGMPISAPFMIVPIIPNLPFYYLCFRAWSHYRALYGAKLLEHLTSKNLIKTTPSPQMNEIYTVGLLNPTQEASRKSQTPGPEDIERVAQVVEAQTQGGTNDVMLMQKWNGALLAEGFGLPEMAIEIERAVEQVEKAIQSDEKLTREKEEQLKQSTNQTTENKEVKR